MTENESRINFSREFSMENGHMEKVKYDLPFILLCVLVIIGNLKPEFIIPGLESNTIARQVPNLLTGLLILIWLAKGRKIFHNKQTKLYIAFVLLLVIDTFLARNAGRALIITKSFILGIFGYLAVISFVDNFAKLKKLIRIFLFCNIFIAIMGIKGGGQINNIPALSDENDFAVLMNMMVPFAFFLCIEAADFRKKIFYFSLTGLFVAGVVVSFSRGGFVGLVCTLLYCFIKAQKKAVVVMMVLVMTMTAYFFIPTVYWDEMSTIEQGAEVQTAATRIYLWKNALKIFAVHPILGVGPNNAGVWVISYDETEQGARDWGRALHSIYFTLLSELGIVGTFLFFAMIYYGEKDKKYIRNYYKDSLSFLEKLKISEFKIKILSNQIRESYFLSLALTGALIGYLSTGIFLSILYYGWFWMIMTYTVILFNVTSETAKQISETENISY